MAEFKVKIHNNHRMQKREREKRAKEYIMTPPKYINKNSLYNYYYDVEKEKGYDYQFQGSKTLKWMKQEFRNKMVKYLGNKTFVKKQTRMDKIHLKQQLNFKNEVNPLITIFSKLNHNIEKRMMACAFATLS